MPIGMGGTGGSKGNLPCCRSFPLVALFVDFPSPSPLVSFVSPALRRLPVLRPQLLVAPLLCDAVVDVDAPVWLGSICVGGAGAGATTLTVRCVPEVDA